MPLLLRDPQELRSELDSIRRDLPRIADEAMSAHGEGAAALIKWVLDYAPTPDEVRLAMGKSRAQIDVWAVDADGRRAEWHNGFWSAAAWVLGETDETPT